MTLAVAEALSNVKPEPIIFQVSDEWKSTIVKLNVHSTTQIAVLY